MKPISNENKEDAMNGLILQTKLDELREQLRELQRRRALVKILYLVTALVALLALTGPPAGWSSLQILEALGAFLILASLIAILRTRLLSWSGIELARMIEQKHPDLNALLLTAVEQLESTEDNLFKERLLQNAVDAGVRSRWAATVAAPALRRSTRTLGAAAALFVLTTAIMLVTLQRQERPAATAVQPSVPVPVPDLVATVTPGDTEVERGARLIVEARFAKDVPADATLVVSEPAGGERERIPMRLTVDQQVFGGLISKVAKDANYRVEFGGERSKDYRITTYVFPALERADVRITPPAYAGLPVKEIKNTLKVTALQGSELAFSFKINKAVKEAELFGEDKTVLPLIPSAKDPTLLTGTLKAQTTQKWRLHLVDDKERANKNPPWISVTVQANQLAKIEVMFPKRDLQISSIQEMAVEAKIWDDVSVTQSGASFNIAGKMKDVVFKHGTTAPGKKEEVSTELMLEQEKVSPRQLVSYYFWAEDKGPNGEVRRAMSDLFFADVRNFEDIFREGEAPPGEPGKQQGETDKLVDLQKQVVNATWRLIRDTQAGRTLEAAAADVKVVQQSEEIALGLTKEAMEKAEDAETKSALTEAWKSMKDALSPLEQTLTEKKATPLHQALAFEQSALEWLHRAQSREHVVMRQSKPSQGAGKQSNQQQLLNLELKQKDQRYEEEKKATAEESADQQENLQVLNRLKELARRQEALAEKMKELQKQMAKAKTAEERNELDNQLKHIEDEQEQLLRDLDDLKERMEKPENAANMADAKEQLEETREKVLDTAEKLKQQQLAEAANAATRAQRDLEKMQEDFKQKTAKRFAEEMKQLRNQARQTSERQKAINEALESQKTPQESNTNDTSAALEKMLNGSEVARQIEEQSAKVKDLLENMRRVSEQAEGNNPLLHQSLYEAVRQAQTGGLEDNLTKAREEARSGRRAEAQDAEHKVSVAVDDLKKGVEKAAESVLGSESEALRMAKAELDKLIMEAQKEDSATQPEMPEPAAASKPPEKLEPVLANANSRVIPPPETITTPPSDTTVEAKAGQPKDAIKPADPDNATLTKSGGFLPGTQPGNPGKSKDMFPTYGPTPQAGKRDGGGLAQNKPADGAPQPPGEGLKDPADMPKKPSPADAPADAPQFPKAAQQLPMPAKTPGNESSPSSSPGASKQTASQEGEGQKPGQGKAPSSGEGTEPGDSPTQSGAKASAKKSAVGQNESPNAPGTPPSGDEGTAPGNSPGTRPSSSPAAGGQTAKSQAGKEAIPNGPGGGNRGGAAMFFDEAAEQENTAPLTGTGYGQWTDRLRNVEELLSAPELRNEAAKVLDRARSMRIDHERNNMAPQADHLQIRIIRPLVELRDRVTEELAKRNTGNPTVPVDRDPVPPAFRELVRRYYTELGAGK